MQAIVDALHVVEGRPVTSSRIVSEYFEKKHSDVVRAIEAISTKKPELVASRNFAQWSEQVEIGSGAKRTVTGYWMDRKGFCLLAMGFTGSKALEFKCAFYDEFDRMEKALSGESGPDFIDEAQQREIQRAVGRRAAGIGKNFSLIYGALKDPAIHLPAEARLRSGSRLHPEGSDHEPRTVASERRVRTQAHRGNDLPR